MDWDLAMTRNREALQRILAMLVAMASAAGAAVQTARPTLPRHLHRAVLRLLRPAEAAARRLIVVAARGLVVPPPRLREPVPARRKPSRTAIVFPPGLRQGGRPGARPGTRPGTCPGTGPGARPPRAAPARIVLPLFDTLRPPSRRPRRVAGRDAPRISLPGLTAPHPLPPKPTPFDPVDATRLNLRISALAAVLDDLPGQALRFARWRARRDARLRQAAETNAQSPDGRPGTRPIPRRPHRFMRLSPLRPGRPPGFCRRARDEVHAVLNDLQQLAVWTLEAPDTS